MTKFCEFTPEVWKSTAAVMGFGNRVWWNQPWPRPGTPFHYGNGDVFDVAASYAFHRAESQAFIDGNKRTAAVAAMVFLARNGVYAQPPTWGVYSAMIDVAEKKKSKADLAEIFRKCAPTGD